MVLKNSAKKSTGDAIKTTSKRAIQKTAEATGDLTGNKISGKITTKAKKSNQRELDIPKEIYISQGKIQETVDDLRLV